MDLLRSSPVPVQLVTGEFDPLTVPVPANPAIALPVVTVSGAGHYPQLSHSTRLADVLAETIAAPPLEPTGAGQTSTGRMSTRQTSTRPNSGPTDTVRTDGR